MNDQVNKVIAAILDAENIQGGAKRGRKRRGSKQDTHHAGGIIGNIRHNNAKHGLKGGDAEDLEGGSCTAQVFASPIGGRYLQGGDVAEAVEVPVTETVEPTEIPSTDLTGGKRSKRKGGSKKRKLPPALQKFHSKQMKIYKQLKKDNPTVAHNVLLKRSMKMAAKSK